MNLRYDTFRVLAALAFFFVAGCGSVSPQQQEEAQVYREIAAQLTPGGTGYVILNPRNVLDGINKAGTEFYLWFTAMDEPPANAKDISKVMLHSTLAWRLSGVEDIQGFGASSIRISGENESPLFHNRTFLMVRPDSKGVLWALPGRENRSLAPAWSTLPAETENAGEIDLTPGDAARLLAGSRVFGGWLADERISTLLGETPESLLDGLSGTLSFASLRAPAGDEEAIQGSHIMLALPDSQGKLAAQLRKFSKLLPGGKIEEGRIEFPPVLGEQAPMARPVALLREGRIVLYSSVAAEKGFASPVKTLADSAEFRRLAAGLPEDGIGFFYSHARLAELLNLAMERFGQSFRMPEAAWVNSQFTVLRRDGNHFLALENSTIDGNQKLLLNQFLLPAAAGAMAAWEHRGRLNGEAADLEEIPDTTVECQIKLEQFKSALTRYAAAHDGAFPAGKGIEGVRELLAAGVLPFEATVCPGALGEDVPAANAEAFDYSNCSYVYYGGFTTKSNPKLPLVTDWPFNHKGAVNVLLVDGTIEKLDLETSNCKRIVGQLQARYHYGEEEFRNLIQQADVFDKLFELE